MADSGNHRIQKFDASGTYLTQWGSLGSGDGKFRNPSGVEVDGSGDVCVADTYNHRIQEFSDAACSMQLAVSGVCPGQVTVNVSGATPNGSVALAWSTSEGSWTVPLGVCAGTQLGLDVPSLLTVEVADANGEITLMQTVPGAACGVFLQAGDISTCEVSNVAQVP